MENIYPSRIINIMYLDILHGNIFIIQLSIFYDIKNKLAKIINIYQILLNEILFYI